MKILNSRKRLYYLVFLIFTVLLVIIRPLGLDLSKIPGDLGDARFNNYILEHNFRWLNGKEKSLLSPPFAYPFKFTLTFSDNHLGSMLFYNIFRWSGLDRETAFQGWFLFSFFLNFFAAVIVLEKFKLNPIAIAVSAFFFTFSLPVLARTGHAQFSYRFCIPLACYSLWQLANNPRFKHAFLLIFWTVWQFFISIYLGFFLSLLLLSLAITIPLVDKSKSKGYLNYWPMKTFLSWKNSQKNLRWIYLVLVIFLLSGLIGLLLPYAYASDYYGFSRTWDEVSSMLPRIQSYFLSDYSKIWSKFSSSFTNFKGFRWEHQLFLGLPATFIIIFGLLWRFKSRNRNMAIVFILSAAILVLFTLNINGFSVYKFFFNFPGVNSIRAVTRIILVLLWPFSLFISIVIDTFIVVAKPLALNYSIIFILLILMFAESLLFNHQTFDKAYTQSRIHSLKVKLPKTNPENPILYYWDPNAVFWGLTELDAMLLSQDLNWPTLNGYSGNLPVGYGPTKDCDQASVRIIRYLDFINSPEKELYNQLLSRIVTLGPQNCEMNYDIQNLSVTYFKGALSEKLISGILLEITSITKIEDYLYIVIKVKNNSPLILPAESSTNTQFKLSWRYVDINNGMPNSGYDNRKSIISDILPWDFSEMTIITTVPNKEGEYKIEISAVQENVNWLHNKGLIPASSNNYILVKNSDEWTIN